ncbi:cytochrome ubiquinol oxidase subunit I [Suttonella ornithocola]|uniref:Cytochrome d ubiquinol oxidase subunit 1 n=1 Tax=Suttonella ornithocola TaxID=279832 RepID=A0A380MN00_9GAMM|nr:cytochrome ubiquinol oxidase subunit I [Suttonella ornithocola]SUO93426.1 Cytochrome d ubiquinol oxidase subunit 1 [Suttonella ornithocola]
MDVIELSRLQFAITALYHFLFVPLTLGLCWILVIMEACYLMTNKVIYRDMVQFWGKLFGINFALGVTTGITMEFQFGTNWAYYSHYVGDIFGAPLAIEGLMAFFLEATLIGLFFLGWNRLSKRQHFFVTIFLALATNLSGLWILIANGWMQHPVGATFNFETMRMELSNFSAVFFNPEAQNKFVHTVSAGYVCGSVFVLAISSWYLLRKRDIDFAKKSFRIAAAFGLASICSVIVLGDESGYSISKAQQTKMAAIEAMWETEPPPASFNLIAWPNEKEMKNEWAIEIPWVMGIIGTRSLDTPIPGIREIIAENEERIRNGLKAMQALEILQKDKHNTEALKVFREYEEDLGFGFLFKSRTGNDITNATEEEIKTVARHSVPKVAPIFWSFRFMVGCGFLMLALFIASFWFSVKGTFHHQKWLLRAALFSLPLPWIAIECGWFVAEYGRQPWTVYGMLPTNMSASSLSTATLYGSLAGFITFYTILLVIEMFLMIRYAKLGPSSLGTGRYALEKMKGDSHGIA